MNYAVILAGGIGERFWPASTPRRPKQLLPLLSDRSMLRETADRLEGVVPAERVIVLTNASLVDEVVAELPELPRGNVIGEPEGKNTAPAIGLAAGLLHARDPEAVVLALPADHAVGDAEAFRDSVDAAFQLAAERPLLVLFGIVPSRPETGYGYVRAGAELDVTTTDAYEVETFLEKPDPDTARELWRDGRHYWNSGLFCGRAAVFLEEYGRHLPLMRRTIEAAVKAWEQSPAEALERFYAAVESTSIDYGIMQQTEEAAVLPAADWGWDDVGSWEALSRWMDVDEGGNVAVGEVDLEGCTEVVAWSESGRIAALGLSEVVIVRTADDTLVVSRDRLADLKSFVRSVTGRDRAGR
ncbi:MAG: sugar phosphate nucleotidyltransferase [Gemmatimonadota bacterium]|nr:sugar phosphate nucleotidyltransferase [Gemmatimonadota bacterium]